VGPVTVVRDAELFEALIEAERAGKSVRDAARRLTVKHPRFKGAKTDTLRDRYYLLKDERSAEGRRLRAYTDSIEEQLPGGKWQTVTIHLSDEQWQGLHDGQGMNFEIREPIEDGCGVKMLLTRKGRAVGSGLLVPRK